MVVRSTKLWGVTPQEAEMKVITKRDLMVIQCVLAHNPNAAGITIKRYVSTDMVAPEYVTAFVSIPGLPRDIRVKVKEENGQWTPISLTIGGVTYFSTKHAGVAFEKR